MGISSYNLTNIKKVNFLIGKNNCNKTSVLESIFLLTAANQALHSVSVNKLRQYNVVDDTHWTGFFHKLDLSQKMEKSAEGNKKSLTES